MPHVAAPQRTDAHIDRAVEEARPRGVADALELVLVGLGMRTALGVRDDELHLPMRARRRPFRPDEELKARDNQLAIARHVRKHIACEAQLEALMLVLMLEFVPLLGHLALEIEHAPPVVGDVHCATSFAAFRSTSPPSRAV